MNMQHTPVVLKSRAQMVVEEPFWGTLAMHLKLVATTAVRAMATDGTSLYYNPEYYSRPEGAAEAKVTWKHEVLHPSLGHHARRGNRDPLRWNIACDHVVNLILKAAGEKLPDGWYCDDRFKGMPAEKIYRVLEDEERQQQQQQDDDDDQEDDDGTSGQDRESYSDDQDRDSYSADEEEEADADDGDQDPDDEGDQQGQGDDGQGQADDQPAGDQSGGDGADEDGEQAGAGSGSSDATGDGDAALPNFIGNDDPGLAGEILDAAPAQDKAANDKAADEWQIFTQQAVNIAKRQGEGKLPGYAEEIVQHMNDPETDWREATRRFVDPISMTKDYSWSHPNRRMLGLGYMVPGTISNGTHHGALIVDSSYSIDTEILQRFGAEVQGALDDGTVDMITLIFCDERVTRTAQYSKGDQIDFTVPGRGGTKFYPAFDWINENAPDVAFAIYFTDLECTDYGDEPPYPVLWAGYGNPAVLDQYKQLVPWGEFVDVGDRHA